MTHDAAPAPAPRTTPSTHKAVVTSLVVASLVAALGLSALSVGAAGCANVDTNRVTDVKGPSFDDFDAKGVSGFLEVRCGSLDCHGQLGRPLRIFSGRGLRAVSDAGAYSGSSGTSRAERIDNYYAVLGLQPEVLRRVVEGARRAADGEALTADEAKDAAPERLLLVSKPRNEVVHKGGAVVAPASNGDRCVTSWLSGATDQAACEASQKY